MGCDDAQGSIKASSKDEAIKIYKQKPAVGYYDDRCYHVMDVQFFDGEAFDTEDAAIKFLEGKMKKWDLKAGMVAYGNGMYAYYVLLPC